MSIDYNHKRYAILHDVVKNNFVFQEYVINAEKYGNLKFQNLKNYKEKLINIPKEYASTDIMSFFAKEILTHKDIKSIMKGKLSSSIISLYLVFSEKMKISKNEYFELIVNLY
jgi:hypothetical protein